MCVSIIESCFQNRKFEDFVSQNFGGAFLSGRDGGGENCGGGNGSTYVSMVETGDETGLDGRFLGHLECWMTGGLSG